MRSTHTIVLLAALSVSLCPGCQTMQPDWSKLWWGSTPPPPKLQESKYPTPIKIAVIWSAAVLNQVGEQSTRGFGGRIYFYDAKNRPVPVEGQLVVYAYNDDQPGNENRPPEKKFAFTPEQFTKHYSPTELGASYSIWIPWDRIGSAQAQVSLIPIFTASSGQLVIGETSHNLLPGPSAPSGETQYNRMMLPPSPVVRADPTALQRADHAVQQASFQQNAPAGPISQAADGLNTMSITLPGSMADQLSGAQPQVGPVERLALQRAALASSRPATTAAPSATAVPTTSNAPKTTTVTGSATLGAVPPPWMSVVPPPVHYGPPSPRAPIAPAPQPTSGQPPTALFPSGQPFGFPATR